MYLQDWPLVGYKSYEHHQSECFEIDMSDIKKTMSNVAIIKCGNGDGLVDTLMYFSEKCEINQNFMVDIT